MIALSTPIGVKGEVWHCEGEGYVRLTRTPGGYDTDSPLFFGNTPAIRELAQRFADCVTAFAGIADPVAEMSRLRQLEARWNAITEAPARSVALLGDGVGSVLADHQDAARVAQSYEDVQRGPAPWIVVECWPKPSLFLASSGSWADSAVKAQPYRRYEDAVDSMRMWGGEVVSLETVVAEMEVVP